MSWKKNVCSYGLWLIYTIAVSLGMVGFLSVGFGKLGYFEEYCFPVMGVLYLIAGLLVYVLHRLTVKLKRTEASINNSAIIIEVIFVVLLFAVGIWLRAGQMQYLTENGADVFYYETAKVAEGNVIPQVVHGATYIYLEVLHILFLLLGNRFVAAVWLQVVLLCVSGIFLYFAVRMLAGKISALVMMGFLMLSPYMLQKSMLLSPEWLYLTIYTLVLWMLANVLKKSNGNPFLYVVVGCFIGVCIYLDLTGVTLLVLAASIFAIDREKSLKVWNQPGVAFLWNILGAVVGWSVVIVVDAMLCDKTIPDVMNAWLTLYQPGAFMLPTTAVAISGNVYVALVNAIVLYAFLVIGIFSFWCRRKQERQGIWIGMAILLIILHCFQMLTPQLTGVTYLYLCLAVLAGVSVADIFAVSLVTVENISKVSTEISDKKVDEASHQESEHKLEQASGGSSKENLETLDLSEQEQVLVEEQPVKKVQLLESPLPLPKKHTPKVMDYRIKDFSEGDYDYDVTDNDDFDI